MPYENARLTRRALLAGVAVGSVTVAAASSSLMPAGTAWRMLAAKYRALPPLEEFDYDQVTISGERQRAQIDNVRAVLLGLDEDSLLQPFRQMSGLPAPGKSLGGWYEWKPNYDYHHDDAGLAPGATFGQWISAMARLHASSGDPLLAERVSRLDQLLADTVEQGKFRGYFARTRFPAYSFDKLVCGLMDAHRLVGDHGALATLDKIKTAAEPELPGRAVDRDTQSRMGCDISWMWDESYTLPENLYLIARLLPPSAAGRYRKMAAAYLDDATLFAPLARGENALGDRQAYSYVNALCSAMQAYLTGGSAMHLDAARNGFDLLEQQSFATGGWGPDETLRKPGFDEVAKSLVKSHNSFEVPCGSYAHSKLTRYLLRATRHGRYGDSMERVLLNTALGALPLAPDGRFFYSADYNFVGKRVYSEHRWPCCSGTLPQVIADYGINSYLYEPARHLPARAGIAPTNVPANIWVNLYQPSTLRWTEGDATVEIVQSGGYPETGDARLQIKSSRPVDFGMCLRVPAWAHDQTLFKINGEPVILKPIDGFVQVQRRWHSGDSMEVALPLALRLEALAGHPELVALLWGSLVLFAVREPGDAGPLGIASDALLEAQRVGAREWRIKSGPTTERTFVPFPELGERSYSTYVTRLGSAS